VEQPPKPALDRLQPDTRGWSGPLCSKNAKAKKRPLTSKKTLPEEGLA